MSSLLQESVASTASMWTNIITSTSRLGTFETILVSNPKPNVGPLMRDEMPPEC